MCGIAGQFCYGGGKPDRDLLSAMSDAISHRGPDGQGIHIDGRAGLVHRRLAIIDLSTDALQPIANEDDSLWLVFNGEIYNYPDLREELIGGGHRFRSHSDSEVILHAYEEWGRDCLKRFNGMWAFAIWNRNRQELFCARDRFGIKPLYYTRVGDSFLFASEIKALLAHPERGKIPNEKTLGTYLAWGVQDHSQETMFEGILQLMPAHTLLLTSEGGGEPSCYWDVHVNPDVSSSEPYEAVAERLHCVLHEATRIHLRSDVPVGTCLSGGIDSSTLSVLINRIIREEGPASVGSRQKTFSAVFSDKRFDESRFIDEIVAATGVDSHKVEPNPEDLWEDIARLVRMQDEPFGSLSIYAQYCVMRTASRQVKVVLDGQGADELLGGYLAYQASYIGGLLRQFHIWTSWGEIFGSLSRHRGFFTSAFGQLFRRRKRRGLLCIEGSRVNRYGGSLDSVLKRELMATNLPALLHYEDRNSMAFSIESRVPYLDVNVVEYIASLPADQKIRRGVTKYCLRNAIRGIVPDAIRCRMDKMGFVTPEEVWMREDLRPFMLDLFSSASFHSRRFWNADAVIRDYLDFIAGKTRYSPEIWRIACTELWLREFFDRRTSSTG